MKLINSLIRKLGRNDYSIDGNLTKYEIFLILLSKGFCLLRGLLLKFNLKKSNGLFFVGKGCKIINRHKISIGKTVMIGDNVEINALSKLGVSIGNNVSILKNTIIECTGVIRNLGEGLTIGNNVGIAQNCFIQVRGKVIIGNNVIFGPSVSIFSENHNFSDNSKFINEQGEFRKGVIIEDGVWLASNVTVLDGVKIGKNSIIGAGSVVTKNIPAYSIAIGNPARVIKRR
ncbi:MAG: acyltransferase [Negativicutes bacterium]|nr:acyltransferase [Negativicutes bacterium]